MTIDESMLNALDSITVVSRPLGVLVIVITCAYVGVKLLSPHRNVNYVSILMQMAVGAFMIMPSQIIKSIAGTLKNFAGFLGFSSLEEVSGSTPQPEAVPQTSASSMDWSWVPTAFAVVGITALVAGIVAGGIALYRWTAPRRNKRRAETAQQASMLEEAKKKLQNVILASARYETDISLMIDYPMMTDLSEITVSRYVKDMRRAQELERALPAKPTLDQVRVFSDAVTDLEVHFDAAVARAEKVRWSGFSMAEKKRLKDAQTALSLIEDSSTTEEQRNAQYKRIVKLLDGLITLTEPVKLTLSARVPMLAIGAGKVSSNSVESPVAQFA